MGGACEHAPEVGDQLGHPCGYAEAVEVGPGPVAVRAVFGEESRVILNIAAVCAVSHTRLM